MMTKRAVAAERVLQTFQDLLDFTGSKDEAELATFFEPITGEYTYFAWFSEDDDEHEMQIGHLSMVIEFPTTYSALEREAAEWGREVRDEREEEEIEEELRRKRIQETDAAVHDVRLTTRRLKLAGIDMDFDVKADGKVLGTLVVSAGGLTWRPARYQKKNGISIGWGTFDDWAKRVNEE